MATMMQKEFRLSMILVLLTHVILMSCKPSKKTESETSDIQILANGMMGARKNHLTGCGKKTTNGSDTIESELERVKQALPSSVLDSFKSWNVNFRLSTDAAMECKEALKNTASSVGMSQLAERAQSLNQACVLPNKSSTAPKFDIILQKKSEAVHNWLLVQSFSLFYDMLSEAIKNSNNPDLNGISQIRLEVANQFLNDLSSTPKVIERYKGMFDSKDKETLGKNERFQNLVLTEMSDSYYCNNKTRNELLQKTSSKIFREFIIQVFGEERQL